MANQVYKETQTYRRTWVMYFILMVELPTLILLLVFFIQAEDKTEMGIALSVVGGTLTLILLFIFNLKLETRIDRIGVSFKFFPFVRTWRKYPREKIQSISVISYSPITDFGGWGLEGNSTTKAYSILGDKGLLLDVGEKKKIMIGTMKANELKDFLSSWKEE
jgi:uncharacterized integral membrane protein